MFRTRPPRPSLSPPRGSIQTGGYRADTLFSLRCSRVESIPEKLSAEPRAELPSPRDRRRRNDNNHIPRDAVAATDNEQASHEESMPASQLDVVLRVRIGLTPLEEREHAARCARELLLFLLSPFLSLFF